MEEELKELPNLTLLLAKRKMRQLRLLRIECINKELDGSSVAAQYGALVLDQEKDLIDNVEKEIKETMCKIDDICIRYNDKLMELLERKNQ